MGEAKTGEQFIKHEFDEAIAIQRSVVDAGTKLSTKHPIATTKREIKAGLTDDKAFLEQLQTMGKTHGATGEIEDVAEGMTELMTDTLDTATKAGSDSDYYEAHAVLVSLKRKQADSAGAMLAIARDRNDAELRKAATTMQKAQIASSNVLAEQLVLYAVKIAAAKA